MIDIAMDFIKSYDEAKQWFLGLGDDTYIQHEGDKTFMKLIEIAYGIKDEQEIKNKKFISSEPVKFLLRGEDLLLALTDKYPFTKKFVIDLKYNNHWTGTETLKIFLGAYNKEEFLERFGVNAKKIMKGLDITSQVVKENIHFVASVINKTIFGGEEFYGDLRWILVEPKFPIVRKTYDGNIEVKNGYEDLAVSLLYDIYYGYGAYEIYREVCGNEINPKIVAHYYDFVLTHKDNKKPKDNKEFYEEYLKLVSKAYKNDQNYLSNIINTFL